MSPRPTISLSPTLGLLLVVVCLALASRAKAEEETSSSGSQVQSGGLGKPLGSRIETHGFSLSNGYGLNALLDQNGSPNANVKLYGGGRLGPGGAYYRQQETQTHAAADPLPQYVDTGSRFLGFGVGGAFVAGAALALALWYSCLWLIGSKRLIDLDDLNKVLKNKDETKEKGSGSSRRRRDIKAVHDDSLTRLAEIVLTSIESGQCMQKSICLVGAQLGATGTTKTALAAKLLEQMIPATVQNSAYFVTLQAALRGKINCDELRCGGSNAGAKASSM